MEQPLPTRWLTFWSVVRLPLGAGVLLWRSMSLLQESFSFRSYAAENLGNAGLLMALFALLVSSGLRKRSARALEENWYIVFGEPVLLFLANIHRQSTMAETIGGYVGSSLVLVLLWLAWSWPNYVYFKKRECLFH